METLSWLERTAITLKAARLISEKFRSPHRRDHAWTRQERLSGGIDRPARSIDFLRFNAYSSPDFNEPAQSTPEPMNRIEYRPLEGIVYTISPFTTRDRLESQHDPVLWATRPSGNRPRGLCQYYLMKVFKEAACRRRY
jgi:1-pyrroline-5-carboxylate dehydrogenase